LGVECLVQVVDVLFVAWLNEFDDGVFLACTSQNIQHADSSLSGHL